MRLRNSPCLLVAVGLLTISLFRFAAPHLPHALTTDFGQGVVYGVGIGLELLGLTLMLRRRSRLGCGRDCA
jgi:hypothetical protein